MPLSSAVLLLLHAPILAIGHTGSPPPRTDYCEMLQQEVQGKKHGFMAGNKAYYTGGTYLVWNLFLNETVGLTHPFHHDLRSRGIGVAEYTGPPNVGAGNDYGGWEFQRDVRAAFGTVIVDGERYPYPAPDKMYWRPDKMVCEYTVAGVSIREEKFIAANDVVSTTITASREIVVEFDGHSFMPDGGSGGAEQIVAMNATCNFDTSNNALHIIEGGIVKAEVMQNPDVRVNATLMYDGMSTVISATKPLGNMTMGQVIPGVCNYTFTIPVDTGNTTLTWAMDYEYPPALAATQDTLASTAAQMAAKTEKVNDMMNDEIPYFRCDDQDIVDVYYYLWALDLMYYIYVGEGQEQWPHTQTAVNNFLGLHNYDSVFQIRVGSWAANKSHFANGNVLMWSNLLPMAKQDQLPDNLGIGWNSGCYGGANTIAHVPGAWQIYEHSGDKVFLRQAYEFYRGLYWNGIEGLQWGYAFDAVVCLRKMAEVLGYPDDEAQRWGQLVGLDDIDTWLQQRWQVDTPDLFNSGKDTVGWTNLAYTGMSQFPDNWTHAMAARWADSSKPDGLFTDVPLAVGAKRNWDKVNDNFAVVPDANWYVLRGLYLHDALDQANKATLAHLKLYNMEWGIPVAPEARKKADFSPFGDMYSNFNAGKILLILEGIGGLSYSVNNGSLNYRDALPPEWSYMEFRVPVRAAADNDTHWVLARVDRKVEGDEVVKTVTIESSPFETVRVHSWTEGQNPVATSGVSSTGERALDADEAKPGRVGYRASGSVASGKITVKTRFKSRN